jgi:hypothetical protein
MSGNKKTFKRYYILKLHFGKKYLFCPSCYTKFEIEYRNRIILLTKDDYSHLDFIMRKNTKNMLIQLYKKVSDEDKISFIKKVNKLFEVTYKDVSHFIQYYKPFSNIKIFDANNLFYCFTSDKKIKKMTKNNSVEKIDDNSYKFIKNVPFEDKVNFIIHQTNPKENKCIECGKTEFLRKFCLIPKISNDIFRKNILIYFWFCSCSTCFDYCLIKKKLCEKIIRDEYNKTCEEIVENYIKNNYSEIKNFITHYIQTYKSISKTDIENNLEFASLLKDCIFTEDKEDNENTSDFNYFPEHNFGILDEEGNYIGGGLEQFNKSGENIDNNEQDDYGEYDDNDDNESVSNNSEDSANFLDKPPKSKNKKKKFYTNKPFELNLSTTFSNGFILCDDPRPKRSPNSINSDNSMPFSPLIITPTCFTPSPTKFISKKKANGLSEDLDEDSDIETIDSISPPTTFNQEDYFS